MNKKQGVIIVVLLALIVCAGILATRLNNNLDYVAGNDMPNGKSTVSMNNSNSKSDFFTEQKLIRDNRNNQTLQNLKSLIDDENVPKESKVKASAEYTALVLANTKESKIEMILKSKGYDEALCTIENKKAVVVVKAKEKLKDKQVKEIQDVVMEISGINDVEIKEQ